MKAIAALLLLLPAAASAQTANRYIMHVKHPKTDTSGDVTIVVHPEWAPIGAKRFNDLVAAKFFDGCKFFRVIEGFMAQVGINGDPSINAQWAHQQIADEPVATTNAPKTITFATSGPDSRGTQIFFNTNPEGNGNLDSQGFSPFAEVVDGFDQIMGLFVTGEGAPSGDGPDQGRIQAEGDAYLSKAFPELSIIESIRPDDAAPSTQVPPPGLRAFKNGQPVAAGSVGGMGW
jgi:cyclophilin family peptidyl-prolyl cis-trans isomerase